MPAPASTLTDLEAKVASGDGFSRADADRLWACFDLPAIGLLGETLRKAWRGEQVTYCRVWEVSGELPDTLGEAGELRLASRPGSADEARHLVRAAAAKAGGLPLTAFSLADLLALSGGDTMALADLAAALHAEGLEAVAEVAVDRMGDADCAAEALRAVARGGLGAWRATLEQAAPDTRIDLIVRVADVQRETGAFRAFAPLPRVDSAETPSTGYEDVRTITMARMLCRSIPSIQVDWRLHGPKLAQVAIAYGADDLDAVPPVDPLHLGHRRAPREDLERQIRAAFALPAERNGRYESLP